MKHSIGLTLIFLFSVCLLSGQSVASIKPDYDAIEKAIKKKKSDLYYPKLMQRYLASDTSMNLKEKRHVYYGYTFQPDYAPYSFSDLTDTINTLMDKDFQSPEEIQAILNFSDSILKDDPFNFRAMSNQLYVYDKLYDRDGYHKVIVKARILFDAILSTGDGLSKETAFYVAFTSHEYALLNMIGFEFGGKQSLIEHYDYLTLAENEEGVEGMYFDVSPCLNFLSKSFK